MLIGARGWAAAGMQYSGIGETSGRGLEYPRVVGRHQENIDLQLIAAGYFLIFVQAGYALYAAKRQKGRRCRAAALTLGRAWRGWAA